MRPIAIAASLAASLIAGPSSAADTATTATGNATLTLNIHEVAHGDGKIWAQVFDGQDGWKMRRAVASVGRPAGAGTAQVTFHGLEPGQAYAVWLYHDENANRSLARDDLGRPVEGWALSTNFQPESATWAFADFSFVLDGEAVTHDVTMRYGTL